jgi:hypothetical protein
MPDSVIKCVESINIRLLSVIVGYIVIILIVSAFNLNGSEKALVFVFLIYLFIA